MRFIVMFVTAVYVVFLIKLRWPKEKKKYGTVYKLVNQEKRKKKRKKETQLSLNNYSWFSCDVIVFQN